MKMGAESRSSVPREGPDWVDAFLAGEYFTNCNHHVSGKNERNQFCTECNEGPICQFGLLHAHAGHRTLQVRKASHMDSIRVIDIQCCLEVSDIQTYSINSAKIVFLLSRPQPRPTKGALHACLCCNRALTDPVRFCSIACKLEVLRGSSDDSITFALPDGGGGSEASCHQQMPLDGGSNNTQQHAASSSIIKAAATEQHHHLLPSVVIGQRKPKKRKVSKRRKWTEKKKKKHKQQLHMGLELMGLELPLLNQNQNQIEQQLQHHHQLDPDSPSTPEKFECTSSRSRGRKGTPHRAPMR